GDAESKNGDRQYAVANSAAAYGGPADEARCHSKSASRHDERPQRAARRDAGLTFGFAEARGNGGDPETIAAFSFPRTSAHEFVPGSVVAGVSPATSATQPTRLPPKKKLCLRAEAASALFLLQRKQNDDDAERCHNRGGGESHGRNFGARMKTFLQSSSKADQKEKKSQADQY